MPCDRFPATLRALTSGMRPTLGCKEAACYNALRSIQEDNITQGVRS